MQVRSQVWDDTYNKINESKSNFIQCFNTNSLTVDFVSRIWELLQSGVTLIGTSSVETCCSIWKWVKNLSLNCIPWITFVLKIHLAGFTCFKCPKMIYLKMLSNWIFLNSAWLLWDVWFGAGLRILCRLVGSYVHVPQRVWGKIRPLQDSIPPAIYVMKSNKLFTVTDYICQL